MPGYLENTVANTESFFGDDWFRTGDLGYVTFIDVADDEQVSSTWKHPSSLAAGPWLTLTGRKKELINRGGEKVSPSEVEAAVLSQDHVQIAVCFPMPDLTYGEQVALAVVPIVNGSGEIVCLALKIL